MNDSEFKNCHKFLKPYQESIWSQDVWIWKNYISGISDMFDFNLGVVGCDNLINYIMNLNGYTLLNCSKNICVNHYDRLSIETSEFGISKGNISKHKINNTIGNRKLYIFLKNKDDIPDKYTRIIKNCSLSFNTLDFSMKKYISEIILNENQIISSSFSSDLCKPLNVLFNNQFYWEPNNTDLDPFIEFNFKNVYVIPVIDISGKQLDKDNKDYGFVTKFKISYSNSDNKNIFINKIFHGIEVINGNYIKKIYLDIPIICSSIKIYPLEYVNIRALKIKFYKMSDLFI